MNCGWKAIAEAAAFQGAVAALCSWLLDCFLWVHFPVKQFSDDIQDPSSCAYGCSDWCVMVAPPSKENLVPLLVWFEFAEVGWHQQQDWEVVVISYWVYPWSRIEELDFNFGSAPDVFGWVQWGQSLSLWLFLLLNCSVCCERTGCMLITAPGAEKSMTLGCDLNYMMITLNYSTAWYWQPYSYYCHIYSLIQMFLSQILFQPTSKYFIFGVSNEKSCSCLVLNYHWFENNQEKE